jgi:hypothetical protein
MKGSVKPCHVGIFEPVRKEKAKMMGQNQIARSIKRSEREKNEMGSA